MGEVIDMFTGGEVTVQEPVVVELPVGTPAERAALRGIVEVQGIPGTAATRADMDTAQLLLAIGRRLRTPTNPH